MSPFVLHGSDTGADEAEKNATNPQYCPSAEASTGKTSEKNSNISIYKLLIYYYLSSLG